MDTEKNTKNNLNLDDGEQVEVKMESADQNENPVEESPIEECVEIDWRGEADKFKDLCLRTQADMENMRKRLEREKEDFKKFANEAIIRDLLPFLDNLERALEHAPGGEKDVESFVEGIRLTHESVKNTLQKFGVKQISALGEPFDPNLHEAVMQKEDAEAANNTVIEEVQKGYLLNERLIRPSMVIISRRPA